MKEILQNASYKVSEFLYLIKLKLTWKVVFCFEKISLWLSFKKYIILITLAATSIYASRGYEVLGGGGGGGVVDPFIFNFRFGVISVGGWWYPLRNIFRTVKATLRSSTLLYSEVDFQSREGLNYFWYSLPFQENLPMILYYSQIKISNIYYFL